MVVSFLEIIYHVQQQRNPSYNIKIQDVIVIRFPFHPSLNQTEQVQSDGTLHLDLVGSVKVFDRTIDDVHDELLKGYKKYVKDPILTVSFKESNVKIDELKESIKTAPRGQSPIASLRGYSTLQESTPTEASCRGHPAGQRMHRGDAA